MCSRFKMRKSIVLSQNNAPNFVSVHQGKLYIDLTVIHFDDSIETESLTVFTLPQVLIIAIAPFWDLAYR